MPYEMLYHCCNTLQVLLQLNAPLHPRTPDEETPRDLALRNYHKKVVDVLEWASQNRPKPRTETHKWLHKQLSRVVSLCIHNTIHAHI